jgi:4-amino-4-deoxy-L-arabinose transferase-like glycosyltransferase
LIFLFVRRVVDTGTALLAALIAATSLSVTVIAKSATADALLNMLIAATMFALFLYYRERRPAFLYATFAAMGLGFLAKGPVAVLIPLAVSFIFYGIKGEWRAWFKAAFNPVGLAVFAAIALPWYVAQYLKEGQAFIDGFFFKHNIERFGGPMEGHAGSLVYYIPVVLFGVLPFTALLVRTLARVRDMFKDDLKLFLLLWFAFVVIFFSLSGTKLPHYVNYGLTGIFILMALYIGELRSAVWTLLAPLVFFAVLWALPEIITYLAPGIQDPYYRDSLRHINDYVTPGYRNFFFAAVALTVYFMIDKKQALQLKLLLTGLMAVFGVAAYLLPVLGNMLQGPVKEAGLLAKREGYELVRYRLNTPSISVYADRIVPDRRPLPGEVVATTPAYLPELGEYELLYVQNGVVVVRLATKE